MPLENDFTPETTEVRKAHKFDEKKLIAYLQERLPHLDGEISIRQFEGGQSNPTFVIGKRVTNQNLAMDQPSHQSQHQSQHQYVLRKKPPGELLQSAHQIEREFKVMSALSATDVAVPKVHFLCEDSDVIGTPFYVMDYVSGRIFRDPKLPGLSPSERADIYDAMNDMLARLHKVDYKEVGLQDYGKKEAFVSRQISRWSKQYQAAQVDSIAPIESMNSLMEWLPQHIPEGDAEGTQTAISHGDFRLENMIFAHDSSKIIAVLDWELSTLGHPYSDLGYNCVVYHLPATIEGLSGISGLNLADLGIPKESVYVDTYKKRTGSDTTASHTFFVVFSLFRLASIVQGILARARQGTASSAKAEQIGALARPFADIAWNLAQSV